MVKSRKKKKALALAQGQGPNFGIPPGGPPMGPPVTDHPWGMHPHPGEFLGPRGPHQIGPPGPMMPDERFHMGPHDFRPPMPPMMERRDPFMDEPRDFMMRGPFMPDNNFPPQGYHPPGFHPQEFEVGPRFHHPEFEGRPMGFHPGDYEGGPPFPHPDFNDRLTLQGCPPPEFARGPGLGPGPGPGPGPRPRPGPGFYPHPYEDMRGPGYPVMDPGCAPMDPSYVPPVGSHGDPGFGGAGGCFGPHPDFMGPGQGPLPVQDVTVPALSAAPVIESKTSLQTSNQTKSESTKSMVLKTATAAKNSSKFVKPPPGRSMGVISFVGNNYGFIEREDLKKFTFPFEAYFGNRDHLVPGVKVHFTAVKELGKECATDVKVAPGGTEDVDETVYEGVVIVPLPDTYVKEPHPGRIRTILSTDPVKLPFGKFDSKVTLLMLDRVKFQLLTDIITKETRASNILPIVPDTFQLTKEIREMGVIMTVKGDGCTIMSKLHDGIRSSVSENVGDDELNVMDEVEFTLMKIKGTLKAVRLRKVPEGSVVFNSKAQNKIAQAKEKIAAPSASKDKWKPVTTEAGSEEANVDVGSEMYEGTIVQVIPKNPEETGKQEPSQGLLESTVEGTQKHLPFRSADVITQATMLVGDKVHFNISINKKTNEECAVNVEIQPDFFETDSEEQRKTGIVVKLEEKYGCIKTAQDQLIFDLSEVMESAKLTLLEKVAFTVMENEGAEEVKRAIRIRKLTEGIFTPGPKLEGLGEKEKEKKKMTIKLLAETKDLIQSEAKTEVRNGDSVAAKKPENGKVEASKAVKPPAKTQKQDVKGKQEKDKVDRQRSRSRETSRRRNSRSRSRSRDRSGSNRRHRSSSRERSYSKYRRSRSRSRDRTHRSRRSRSRSKERHSRGGRKRSRSPEYKDGRRRDRSSSKEHSSKEHSSKERSSKELTSKRRSKTPDKKSESAKSSSKSAASSSSAGGVEDELAQKKKELLELNELIARKRAIIAMEQNTKSFKDVLEMDRKQGFATFDYQHKTCLENTWMPDLKPAKSILKKHSDPLTAERQATKRSLSPEELVEYPKSSTTTSLYACPVPSWMKENPFSEDEDHELQRKKKQLEELSESIARKRAIVAMKQKSRVFSDEPEIKRERDLDSYSDDFSAPVKNTWQPEIKPDLQPKKSILKKRSEPPADQPQIATTSTASQRYSQSLFPIPPQDNYSAHSKPVGSSHTDVETTTNQPNTFGIFERVINKGYPTSSSSETSPFINQTGPPLFPSMSNSGPFYGQKSIEESKASSYKHIPEQPTMQDPTGQPSTSTSMDQKRNLATQMQRFLTALNKADSNLVSSLLREGKKESLGTLKPPQDQSDQTTSKEELYDPFKETDDNEDLLPHERAVQDGSGFSRLVGMKYGAEAKAESRFFYEEKKASSSQSRISEERKPFSEHKEYELYGGPYSNFEHQRGSQEGHQNLYSQGQDLYAENREKYEGQRGSERNRVGGRSVSPVQQKPENTTEDASKKSEHFEKIQNLLQTIGLKLNTSEVSKLADRTRERLYGKAKSQSASSQSSHQKEMQSGSRNDRRGSRADSSDSEGVRSVSPARSSNREVYMSYWDSVKNRDQSNDEVGGMKEKDLLNLQMTIKNSPEARQVTPDPHKRASSTKVTQDSPKHTKELPSTSAQYSISSFYTQPATESSWESSYHLGEGQISQEPVSPYGSIPPSPLPYAAGIHMPPPPGYGPYGTTPPFLGHPSVPPHFSTPIPFGPPPAPPFPPPTSLFEMCMPPGGPGYATANVKVKVKSAALTRCLKTIETMQTNKPANKPATPTQDNVNPPPLSVQPSLISIQTVAPADLQRDDESKQAAPTTEEDIKAKQKKRLEQFNQRMRLKKEQQMEAQRARGQSQKTTTGKLTRIEVKNVWICGHSLVFWAEKRATSPEIGMQLGMDPNTVRIWWKGVQGMTWTQLLPQLLQLKDNWPKPDVILMHLGGNDLGKTTPEAFLAAVKKDLVSMKSIFPECLLVWSDILPRMAWRHSEDSAEVDNMRKAINKSIRNIVTEVGGSCLTHENIKPGLDLGLYRPDGVHLSGKGIDTFNLNMQDFLEKWESEINERGPSEN